MQQIVFGTGFPRSGTTSLAEALTKLGYKTIHHCPFTADFCELREDPVSTALDWIQQPGKRAVVSSELLKHVSIFEGLPTIYLHRDIEDCQNSLMRLGIREFDLSAYKHRVPKHSHFVATEDLGWERICPFLGAPIPADPFPWTNKS